MADPALRLPTNATGAFFVDRTCIDCDTCRRLAPANFAAAGSHSTVRVQPRDADETLAALQALLACPVGAIGDLAHRPLDAARASFPQRIAGPVHYLGYHARSSYGAASYLLEHPGGNWMIDSPRWNGALVHALERVGGLHTIFLTHRDDVADAARYARHFGARRVIHERDRAAMPDAEVIVAGDEPIAFGDCTVIPTPGHTRGHCVLHHRDYLFSGDHASWDPHAARLRTNRHVCWFDWPTQVRSLARLCAYDFRWLLPGHGQRVELPVETMRAAFAAAVRRADNATEPA